MPPANGVLSRPIHISVAPAPAASPRCSSGSPGLVLHRLDSRRLLRELNEYAVLTEHCGHVALPVTAGSAARSPDDPLMDPVATATGQRLLSW